MTTASTKISVSEASRTLSATSFGVFCRFAPSTRAIIRSMNVSPGLEVILTTIRSDSTLVPPVTADRSPPDSRMTGADSPVMADSSTEATPSTTSPSPLSSSQLLKLESRMIGSLILMTGTVRFDSAYTFKAIYNFAVDGGAVGAITPAISDTIPARCFLICRRRCGCNYLSYFRRFSNDLYWDHGEDLVQLNSRCNSESLLRSRRFNRTNGNNGAISHVSSRTDLISQLQLLT